MRRWSILDRQPPQPPARRPPGPGPVPACPAGFVTGPPDFVGVGSKKAGTGWWHRLITSHPEVHRRPPARPGLTPPGVKELHFFQERWAGAGAGELAPAYHHYFPRPPGKLVGEWTPRYMVDFWTPAQLHLVAPEARILVLVRDPVERYRSGVSHYLARHDGMDHPRVLVDEVEHGRYVRGLSRLRRHFPKDQILVLQLEQCIERPEVELARTYEFLGLHEPGFLPTDIARPVNEAAGVKVSLHDGIRAELVAEYEAGVARLAEQWPIDLSLWPNFAYLS